MISVRELCKSYFDLKHGSITAVQDVSFDAKPGEVFGLLGPNGAGKTTLLRILSTVLQPSSGSALICGLDVAKRPDQVRRRIGFVSANTAVYDRMTAWEMAEHFARLYGLSKGELQPRLESLFTRLKMNDMRDVLGAKMSTGMRQKTLIARALVHDPDVLIFDEATVGLDVLAARAVLETVQSLRDSGKCVIFSTHIMREVEKVCDRVAILHHGSILAAGTVAELRGQLPGHDFEDWFFELLAEHDAQRIPSAPVAG